MRLAIEPWLRDAVAGSCAIAIGLGLARYDFSAVAHLMVATGSLATSSIGQLSAFNLGGYLLGCIHHMYLSQRTGSIVVLRCALLAVIASLLLEWVAADFVGQAAGRLLAGWGAGHLMSGMPALAIQAAPSPRQRQASALVMSGAGFGALLGACAITAWSQASSRQAWLIVLIISLVLAGPVIWLLRRRPAPKPPHQVPFMVGFSDSGSHRGSFTGSQSCDRGRGPDAGRDGGRDGVRPSSAAPLLAISLACFCAGGAQVPVVLYAPLLMSERLGSTASHSSASLAVLGSGCVIGALLAASCPVRWPTRALLPVMASVGLVGTLLFWQATTEAQVGWGVFLVGAWLWLFTSLTFDRLGQLLDDGQRRRLWPLMTLLIALGFGLFSLLTASLARTRLDQLIVAGLILMVLQLVLMVLQGVGCRRLAR